MVSEEELHGAENNIYKVDLPARMAEYIRELQEQIAFKTAQKKGEEKASNIVLGLLKAENVTLQSKLDIAEGKIEGLRESLKPCQEENERIGRVKENKDGYLVKWNGKKWEHV